MDGIKFIKNNISFFAGKKIIVFATGATAPIPEEVERFEKDNIPQRMDIAFFYGRINIGIILNGFGAKALKPFCFGGGGEIRTLETLLTPTRFPVVRPRPARRLLQRFI